MQDEQKLLEEIGGKIRERRTELRMGQEELAEKVFISAKNVSRHENGAAEMHILTLFRYAEALQMNPDDLIPEKDLFRLPEDSPLIRIVKILSRQTPEVQAAILTICKQMLQPVNRAG